MCTFNSIDDWIDDLSQTVLQTCSICSNRIWIEDEVVRHKEDFEVEDRIYCGEDCFKKEYIDAEPEIELEKFGEHICCVDIAYEKWDKGEKSW